MKRLLIVALLVVAVPAAGWTADQPKVDIERPGTTVVRARTDTIDIVVSHRQAGKSPVPEWMMLEVAMTARPGGTATIERDDITLTTPDGESVRLATQKELAEAYTELQAFLARAEVDRDPLGYFPPGRKAEPLQFFQSPGAGVVFDLVQVNWNIVNYGKIFFQVPGGVGDGTWTLVISAEDTLIEMPFDIPPSEK